MSPGAMNWPFFTLTAAGVAAAASNRSVCRARNAGICNTAQTSAAAAACSGRWISVVTGKPVWRRTSSNIRSPASNPGPRSACRLVRFALSNEALNTTWTAASSASAASRSAICKASSRVCKTQGPATNNRSCPPPQRYGPTGTAAGAGGGWSAARADASGSEASCGDTIKDFQEEEKTAKVLGDKRCESQLAARPRRLRKCDPPQHDADRKFLPGTTLQETGGGRIKVTR